MKGLLAFEKKRKRPGSDRKNAGRLGGEKLAGFLIVSISSTKYVARS